MRRLTIFAKGNLDVRDSLHSHRSGDAIAWNGINEAVRRRFPSTQVRIRHETSARSDALLLASGVIPNELAQRALPLSPYSLEAQFGDAVYATQCDAYVLSIQPDITAALVRHRGAGYLLHPANWEQWSQADRHWLHSEFEPTALLDAASSMRNFAGIVSRIRQRSSAPILVYNVSSVVPGERVHCHAGLDEILSTRVRRFNLALADLSHATGVSVIDVDAIVARAGADRIKLDTVHLTAEGSRLVAEDVVRVLEEYGLFDAAGG